MAKKLTLDEKKSKLYAALKKSKKPVTAAQAVDLTSMSKEDVKEAAKALMQDKKVQFADKNRTLLEVVPTEKSAEKKSSAKPKVKKTPVEDDDWDEDDEDDEDEDDEDSDDEDEDEDPDEEDGDEDESEEEDDEDSEDEDEDDEDEDDPDEEDEEDDDDEDEAPVKKGKKGAKVKEKAQAKKTPAVREFSQQFKPIDTLTRKEINARIESGLEAAEALYKDGHKTVSELIMRQIPRLRKQLKKRDED